MKASGDLGVDRFVDYNKEYLFSHFNTPLHAVTNVKLNDGCF